ncbi:MAG: peptidase C69 [[Candidatus Thermochlorobacteriaceae] bacterium GBChlB]|nr:MAG: peptidase C69 [[Candidatus Thermochlorobacteriaceae] bacterium GBChlB]
MALLSKSDAEAILKKVIAFSKADDIDATLNGGLEGNIRYARNSVSTSGLQDTLTLAVQSRFGKKVGSASINEFDEASIEKCVRRSEELAQLAPDNPETMPSLEPQTYLDVKGAFESTEKIAPDFRAKVAEDSIVPAAAKKVVAAGFFNDTTGFQALMNKKGLYAYYKSTTMEFSVTMRTEDGTGSGYAVRSYSDVSKFDSAKASQVAIDKALQSRDAKAIEPGKYTVILEPAALLSTVDASLLGAMIFAMDARQADEGRSFFAKKGGGNKIGEQIVDERVNIYADPQHPEIPSSPFVGDGRAREKMMLVEKGVVKNLFYSRYWAEKQGKKAIPPPGGVVMQGGDASLDDLIKDTKRGILVTRLWYIRPVDPQTLLYTGLTRDGTFFIENGKIKHPVKNFRFNESPIIMLNNLEALGNPERIGNNLIPPIRVRDFTFTSLSDAV